MRLTHKRQNRKPTVRLWLDIQTAVDAGHPSPNLLRDLRRLDKSNRSDLRIGVMAGIISPSKALSMLHRGLRNGKHQANGYRITAAAKQDAAD